MQIIDAVLNVASNDQKTEVVPPAEVPEDLPLPSNPKVIFLGSIRTCGAGGGLCREIVGGFTRVTCSAGHAGVGANSQLAIGPESVFHHDAAYEAALRALCSRTIMPCDVCES